MQAQSNELHKESPSVSYLQETQQCKHNGCQFVFESATKRSSSLQEHEHNFRLHKEHFIQANGACELCNKLISDTVWNPSELEREATPEMSPDKKRKRSADSDLNDHGGENNKRYKQDHRSVDEEKDSLEIPAGERELNSSNSESIEKVAESNSSSSSSPPTTPNTTSLPQKQHLRRSKRSQDAQNANNNKSGYGTRSRSGIKTNAVERELPSRKAKKPTISKKKHNTRNRTEKSKLRLSNSEESRVAADGTLIPRSMWTAEAILDLRRNDYGRLEYLVQWKEWGKKSTSWEPEYLLNEDCDAIIKKFFQDDLEKTRKETEAKRLQSGGLGSKGLSLIPVAY